MLNGPATRVFDDEGLPARKMDMVKDGIIQSYFTDLATANKLSVQPGGHAMRASYTRRPEISTSNFSLAPGTISPEEIISGTPRGFLLNNLSGWWVGLSPVDDTFSAAATGYWIENGEIAYPVMGVNISGSLREMLTSIDQIGNDLTFRAPTSTPTFRVAEMSISGT